MHDGPDGREEEPAGTRGDRRTDRGRGFAAFLARREGPAGREALLAARLETLLRIATRLSRSLDTRDVCTSIVEEANRGLRADSTTIRVLRDGRLEPMAWAGMSDETAAQLPMLAVDEPWFRSLVAEGGVRAISDVRQAGRAGYERNVGAFEFAGELAVPLIRGADPIGVLRATTRRPRTWSADDREFMRTLASHAALAVHNAEQFERTERHAAQLAAVQAATARMTRARSLEAVGRAIVEETARIVAYGQATVHVLEAPQDLVAIAVAGGRAVHDLEAHRSAVGVGAPGWVAEHGEPLLVPDVRADPRTAASPGAPAAGSSLLAVPLRTDEGTTGVITLTKPGRRQFDEGDLRLLAILAGQAATALESARRLQRLETFTHELRRLVEMSSALSGSLDPRQVAALIAEHMARAMGADECAISYWDRHHDRVLTMGYYPPTADDEIEPSFDIAEFPETRRVLQAQVTVIVDAEDASADPAEKRLLQRDGNRMLAMLPLVAKGQSIGLAELISNSWVEFDDQRLALVRTMANEAAMALENARLYEEARALADRDQLTGFYNHRYLHERLGEEVVRAQRSRQPLSLLMLDLDDFKLVNDTFGHLFGDRVLAWVGERIRSSLRASDVPARYGGDEFAVVLPETDAAAARVVAERIVDALSDEPFTAEGRGPLPLGVSIGIAAHPLDGRTGTQLLAAADERLYAVKRGGTTGSEAISGPPVHIPPRAEDEATAGAETG